jgi:hypothetical protein
MERQKLKEVNNTVYLRVALKSMGGCKMEKKGSKRLEIKLEVALVNA